MEFAQPFLSHDPDFFGSLTEEQLESFLIAKNVDFNTASVLRRNAITGSLFVTLNDSDFMKMSVPYGHVLLLTRIIRELNTKACNQVQAAPNVIVPSPQKRGNDVLLEIGSVNVGLPKKDAPLPNGPSVDAEHGIVCFANTASSNDQADSLLQPKEWSRNSEPDGSFLLEALENCPDGKKLLDEYKSRNPKIIHTRERKLIVNVGVDLLIKKTVSSSKHYPEAFEKICLAKEIVALFSCLANTRANTAYVAFYTPVGKGYIDQRLQAIRSELPPDEKMRKRNHSEKKRECKHREYLYDTDKNLDECIDDAEAMEKMDWLKTAVCSLAVNRSQIQEYMDSTYSYRRKSIKSQPLNNFDSINNAWPRLTDFNKGQLIFFDLQRRFPKLGRMADFFLQFGPKLIKYAKANGINVEENGNENLMALIASIDSFPRNMEFARNGSVPLSNRVILFKKGNMVVEDFIRNRPPYLAQPFLINNGTLHQPGSYYVIIDKLPVSVGNDLCWAFEVLFAVFFVFNLSYPPLLDQWYHFIEDVAFGIAKKSSPTIQNFVSQILNV